jgi:hypothetical protein
MPNKNTVEQLESLYPNIFSRDSRLTRVGNRLTGRTALLSAYWEQLKSSGQAYLMAPVAQAANARLQQVGRLHTAHDLNKVFEGAASEVGARLGDDFKPLTGTEIWRVMCADAARSLG